MKKWICLAAVIMGLVILESGIAEEYDYNHVTMMEGQTLYFDEGNGRIVNWDHSILEMAEEKASWIGVQNDIRPVYRYAFKAVKPGEGFMDSNYIGSTGPYTVTVLARTEIPEWLPGIWDAKITAGPRQGYKIRYVFYDDGIASSLVYKGSLSTTSASHYTYACGDGMIRFDAPESARPVTIRIEGNTIVPFADGLYHDDGTRYSAFKKIKEKQQVPKKITIKPKHGILSKKERHTANESESFPEGSPGLPMWVSVEPEKIPEPELRFHSTDPSVAVLQYSPYGVELCVLKQGTAEVWASLYGKEDVVSNKTVIRVTPGESVPETLTGCMWKVIEPGIVEEERYYIFLPGGKSAYLYMDNMMGLNVGWDRYTVSGNRIITSNDFSDIEHEIITQDGRTTISLWERKDILTGWQEYFGDRVYYDEQGIPAHSGWFEVDGKRYAADSKCRVLTGECRVDGIPCSFDENGVFMSHQFTNREAIREFVDNAYRVMKGKYPKATDAEAYVEQIMEGIATPTQFIYDILFTEEVQQKASSNDDFIKMLYKLYDGAKPMQEREPWVRKLDRGMTREDAASGFAKAWLYYLTLNGMK